MTDDSPADNKEPTIMTAETVVDRIARLNLTDVGSKRLETLTLAHSLVDDVLFAKISDALRVSRTDSVVLPAHRFEGLSRGRGWARQGTGDNVRWGERQDGGGYRVSPGRWSVGATDGFSRKRSDTWTVIHVTVGAQTWTLAS